MSKVLFIKANDRPQEQAISVQMYESFLQGYRETHPHDQIEELDLFAASLPYYDHTMMTGLYKLANGLELTPEEQRLADVANAYLDQFLAADKVVLAFPLWNFTIPAQLLTYLFYITQVGKTFKYTAEGAVGLAGNKKVMLLNARGGDYSSGPGATIEMSLHYVKTMMNFIGVTDHEAVVIEGHQQFPEKREEIVASGLRQALEAGTTF